jgi:hypothetical protein
MFHVGRCFNTDQDGILRPTGGKLGLGDKPHMSKESKTTKHGRDARTGEFTTVEEARRHPNTHVVERVPKPGYGDTKSGSKK